MAHAGQRRRSVEATRYSMVPKSSVPRSAFDISHTHKTTFDARLLIPVFVHEILPGDSLRLNMYAFARLATPVVPVMDNLILESFFFFVPNRLIWDNWQAFMGEKENPGDSTTYLVPQIEREASITTGDLFDYFGISQAGDGLGGPGVAFDVNALPFRAYNLIYNEWFRDEDLQDSRPVPKDDGPDDPNDYPLRPRGKRHDYFTSARPWPQKPLNMGTPGISDSQFFNDYLPQAGAPVSGLGGVSQVNTVSGADVWETGRYAQKQFATGKLLNASGTDNQVVMRTDSLNGSPDVRVLINDMRLANAVQLLLEQRARGGTRYAELLREIFGVQPLDARLQRPEYLGGGRTFVNMHPVAQQSATGIDGSTTVLGELAAFATAVANKGHGFSHSFTEHGWVMGLVNIRADLSYSQGTDRMWFRRTQLDYYWPALAHLGEQAIQKRELYSNGHPADMDVFGFQGRYDEYRYKPNRISGAFRHLVGITTGTLDFWHLGQEFITRPALNSGFIEEDPPIDRVLQVGGMQAHQVLFDGLFDMRMVRCMPMFAIPGLGPRL